MGMWRAALVFLRALLIPKAHLAVENLALRQQLAVLKQSVRRPRLRPRDRVFWVWLSRFWSNWRCALAIVQPDTVVRWHRQGFKLYWRWKSRPGKPGRPPIEREVRDLIRQMSKENPTWGAPRIVSELALLGHDVAEGTVAKYMVKRRKPPSQTWRTFLDNHMIVLGERHLHRILTEYFNYYHDCRCHLSLDRNSPTPREAERSCRGEVVAIPYLGGLHHRYTRRAA